MKRYWWLYGPPILAKQSDPWSVFQYKSGGKSVPITEYPSQKLKNGFSLSYKHRSVALGRPNA